MNKSKAETEDKKDEVISDDINNLSSSLDHKKMKSLSSFINYPMSTFF